MSPVLVARLGLDDADLVQYEGMMRTTRADRSPEFLQALCPIGNAVSARRDA
jgi:hypothetical protein